MSDAILVLNAGSSSIRFSLFLEHGESLELFLGGQLEGLYTAPRFKARDASGSVIGEHAIPIRERVCKAAAWLGVDIDSLANAAGGPRISTAGSRISAWVIPTNEELMIARHTRSILDSIA